MADKEFVGLKVDLKIPTKTEIKGKVGEIQKILNDMKVTVKFNISDDTVKGLERLARMSKKAIDKFADNKVNILDNEGFKKNLESLKGDLSKVGNITNVVVDMFGKINIAVDKGTNGVQQYSYQWDEVAQKIRKVNEIAKESIKPNYTTRQASKDEKSNIGDSEQLKQAKQSAEEYKKIQDQNQKAEEQHLQRLVERRKALVEAEKLASDRKQKDAQVEAKTEEQRIQAEKKFNTALQESRKAVRTSNTEYLEQMDAQKVANRNKLDDYKQLAKVRLEANRAELDNSKKDLKSSLLSSGKDLDFKQYMDFAKKISSVSLTNPNWQNEIKNIYKELSDSVAQAKLLQKQKEQEQEEQRLLNIQLSEGGTKVREYYLEQQKLSAKAISDKTLEIAKMKELAQARIQTNADNAKKSQENNQATYDDLSAKFTNKLRSNESSLGKFINVKELEAIKNQFNAISASTPNLKGAFKTLNTGLDTLITTARIAQRETETLKHHNYDLAEAVELAGFKMFIWQTVGDMFFGAMSKIREGFDFILEQTKLFTNLQMEMTDTNLSFGEITSKANSLASAMGTTSDSVMEAISVFGTYTSTIDEVLKKTESAIILSNITGESLGKSSDELMATLAQFRMGADNSMHIVDLIASVSRNLQVDFPKAVSEISNGMRTVGAVAQEAGVSVEQLGAMLGTLVETTRRSGSQVANGLKTIFSRLQRVSEETNPEEYKKVEKALWDVGIAMKSSADEMRPAGEVLEELSQKWKTLTDVQRANVSEQVAGVYQRNVFISLMQNYDKVLENTTSAMNSEGVAMQKQNIHMQSLQASINKLKNEWQQFYLIAINNDSWKTIVDGTTAVMNTFNKFAELVGGIPAIIGTLVASIALFSTRAREGFLAVFGSIESIQKLNKKGIVAPIQFGNFGVQFGKLNDAVNKYKLNLIQAQMRAEVLGKTTWVQPLANAFSALAETITMATVAETAMTVATVALEAVMSLGLAVAITALIGYVSELIDEMYVTEAEAKEFVKELTNSIGQLKTEVTQSENLISTYEKLASKTKLTTEEKAKMVDIQRQLAETFPATVTGFDNEGRALSQNMGAVKEYIGLKRQELELKQKALGDKFMTTGGTQIASITADQKELAELSARASDLRSEIVTRSKMKGDTGSAELKTELETVSAKIVTLSDRLAKNKVDLAEWTKAFIGASQGGLKLTSAELTKVTSLVMNMKDMKAESIINLFGNDDFANKFKEHSKTLEAMAKNTKGNVTETKEYKAVIDDLAKALGGVDPEVVGALVNRLYGIKDGSNEAQSATENLSVSVDTVLDVIKDAGEKLEVYNTILHDVAKTKKMTATEAMNLIAKHRELASVFTFEGDIAKVNIGALNQLRQARIDEVGDTATAEKNKLKIIGEAMRTEVKYYKDIILNLGDVAKARALAFKSAKASQGYAEDAPVADKYDQQIIDAKAKKYNGMVDNYRDALKASQEIDQLANALKSPNYGVSGGGGGGKKGGGGDSKLKQLRDDIKNYKSELIKAKDEYNSFLSTLNKKASSGLVAGMDIFKEKLKNQENYVTELYEKMPENLDKILKDWQTKLSQSKKGSKEYTDINAIIGKIKSDIKSLPALQNQQATVLKNMRKNYEAIEALDKKRENSLKLQVGLVKGTSIGEEVIKQKEDRLTDLYNKVEDLDSKIFGNELVINDTQKRITSVTQSRNKFKVNTKEWKSWEASRKTLIADNNKLINQNKGYNKEKSDTLELIVQQSEELKKSKELQDKFSKDVESTIFHKKVDLGLVQGFEQLDVILQNSKGSIDGLVSKLADSNLELLNLKELLNDKDLTAQQRAIIEDTIKKEQANQIEIEKNLKDQTTSYKDQEKIIKKIISSTDILKNKLKSAVDNIKGIIDGFKDTMEDVFVKTNINDKLQKDVFGTPSEIFDTIDDAMKTKILGLEKFKRQLLKANTEVGTVVVDLLDKQAKGTITEAEKAQLQEITTTIFETDDEIKKLLSENGLSSFEIANLYDDYNAILGIRNKQKDEIKKIQDELIPNLEKQMDLVDGQVEGQYDLNRLKMQEIGLTKQQIDLDNMLNDRRFEFITSSGQRFLTFDRQQAKELSKESIKEIIQKRIDAYRDYLEKDLPKIHDAELKKYMEKWLTLENGEVTLQTNITSNLQDQSTARIKIIDDEIKEITKKLGSGYTSTIPVNIPLTQFKVPNDGSYMPYYPNSNSYSNSTIINIGNITLDGKEAETFSKVLKDLGLSVASR